MEKGPLHVAFATRAAPWLICMLVPEQLNTVPTTLKGSKVQALMSEMRPSVTPSRASQKETADAVMNSSSQPCGKESARDMIS